MTDGPLSSNYPHHARWRYLGAALTLLGSVIAIAVLVQFGALLLTHHQGALKASERLAAENAARGSLIALVAGLGVSGGLFFTGRSFMLARASQRDDRLTKAIEQIGHPAASVRAGAVYSMLLLARDADDYWSILEPVLAAFVRERARIGAVDPGGPDVQAALTVLGARPQRSSGFKGQPVDLSSTDLSGLRLSGGNFRRTRFAHSRLTGSSLVDTHLEHADLTHAILDTSNLSGADLSHADLSNASLASTNCFDAKFQGSDVTDANFTSATHLCAVQLADARGHARNVPAP